MESKVKIAFEGETVDAEEIGFAVLGEEPLSYSLSDGALIRIDHKVKTFYRLCDRKKEDGSPLYVMFGETKVHLNPQSNAGQETSGGI